MQPLLAPSLVPGGMPVYPGLLCEPFPEECFTLCVDVWNSVPCPLQMLSQEFQEFPLGGECGVTVPKWYTAVNVCQG